MLEARKSLIVVVNDALMNNHQSELAEKLGGEGYLEYCVCSSLVSTIEEFNPSSLKRFPPGEINALKTLVNSLFSKVKETGTINPIQHDKEPNKFKGQRTNKAEKDGANYLRASIASTFINILLSVSFGIITYAFNAFIFRQVSKEVLGTIKSRLCLLSNTILYLSRESFRRSCQKETERR